MTNGKKGQLPVIQASSLSAKDGKRNFVHPADVKGRFVLARNIVFGLLIGFWALLPWIPINGNPALFLDVDGTLLEFADQPDGVRSTPRLKLLLQKAHIDLGGAEEQGGRDRGHQGLRGARLRPRGQPRPRGLADRGRRDLRAHGGAVGLRHARARSQ